ncbi:mechanosensitive ion channel family protein [Crocosphaera sp.]|uniref:mechanosensitive ion channel family protein n=1 Tax=Crocosphaera sp. TaxID=2729996 RepID=UPI003F27CFCD|nr:mechanosensitive ion channel family protein [Crocosphaera sp.]
MNFSFNLTIQEVIKLISPLFAILCGFIIGVLFEKRVITNIKKLADKTESPYYKILINSIQGFSILWFSLGGIAVATSIYPIPPGIQSLINKFLIATFLASATLVISRLLVGALKVYTTDEQGISPLTSLFELLTKIVIYSLGVLIILQSIGIQITPLLTALGVGGVSLGLALQTPLANLISGVSIVMSGKVKPGDYISLPSGENGYVIDVELKYTVLKEITDNVLVIPNSKILSGSFKNFSLPDKMMVFPVTLDVAYNSDLETVEKITLEVANNLLQEKITEEDATEANTFEPFIRYNKFDYYSINLTVYLRIYEQEFFEHLAIKHQFLKELHKRYQVEGIEIPFPIKSAYFPPQKIDNPYNVQ